MKMFFKSRGERPRPTNLYKDILDRMKEGTVLTPAGNKYAKTTIRNYKIGLSQMLTYQFENGEVFLDQINRTWIESFNVWLIKKRYCKNTVTISLMRLRSILKRLYDDGKCHYNGAGIKRNPDEVTTVYNTIEDIRKLLDVDFSNCPGKDRIRYIYVLHCFLGLRFNDFIRIIKDPKDHLRSVGGKRFFEIKTSKTGEVVVIPIGDMAIHILDRLNWQFGAIFSYQYYNKTIKEIAKDAGITDTVIFSRIEGGERVDVRKEKYELMSSHTARRTFASNAYLSGMRERDIMRITGHKTTHSFYRYIRCENMSTAISIAGHEFFKINLPFLESADPCLKNLDLSYG